MSIRYGNKIGPLVSRKSSFFRKNRFDRSVVTQPSRGANPTSTNTWTRPADWLAMPTITSSEQKIALLMPVFPQGSNFLAFLISGAYTVDWGDGVVENFAAGVKAQHSYDYTDPDLNATVTSDGYKMAVVVITPQAGQNLTSVNFNQPYAITGSTFPNSSPILEIILSCPNLTSLSLGGANATAVFCKSLIHFSGVNMGLLTGFSNLFNNLTALKQVSSLFTTATITNVNGIFNGCRSLVSVPLFNTASVTNMSFMFSNCNSLVSVPFFNTSSVTNMSNMFDVCNSLVSVPLFDTSKVTTMNVMFQNCNSLVSVPLFNTSLVTTMASMFNNCTTLTSVPLFDTSKVTNMFQMFQNCRTLTAVPLFNTSLVTTMELMFQGCSSLTSVPLFNTSKVTNMGNMFQNCLTLRDVPLFDTSKVTNIQQFVRTCPLLTTVPAFNTSSATNMQAMFAGCPALTTVPFFDTSNVTNMTSMFDGCNSLVSVPLFDTSKVTTMNFMFQNCNSLISVPLFNTFLVTTMANMFTGCASLTTVPQFNTVSVTNMGQMFQSCISLVSVPLFETSNVTGTGNMFNSCTSLVSVPLFDTSKVATMGSMFANCYSLTSVPSFNTPLVTDMSSMFQNCSKLVFVPQLNTAAVLNMNLMFSGCSALVTIPLLNVSSATSFTNTFLNCPALTRGALSGTRFTVGYSGCKLSKEELESILNGLNTIGAASQTLNITNNWGAPNAVSLAATTTANSTTITMASTTGLVVGMQVLGTNSPLTTARAVTFTAGNTVTIANHGLSDGDEVSFATIVTTTGIVINTIYYVVNAAAGSFQVAASVGGAALTLTGTGSGTMRHRTEIVSITPNTSIVVSRPMSASGATTLTFRQLKTGTALLKGWTVSV